MPKPCSSHKTITKIKLMADHSSNHVWCGICGMELSLSGLQIPNYIRIMIGEWGYLWDIMVSRNTGMDEERYKNRYTGVGIVIQDLLSEFYDCEFANHIEIDFKLKNERMESNRSLSALAKNDPPPKG